MDITEKVLIKKEVWWLKQFKRILAGLTAAAVFTTSFTTAVYAKTTKETKVEYPKLNLSFAVNGTDTQIDFVILKA